MALAGNAIRFASPHSTLALRFQKPQGSWYLKHGQAFTPFDSFDAAEQAAKAQQIAISEAALIEAKATDRRRRFFAQRNRQ